MKKVKITADSLTAEILREFFKRISSAGGIIKGLEVEHLVLLEWHRKNYLKTQFEKNYKISLMPHEAISLYRMLFNIGLTDPMAAITRDGLCDQLAQQLPAIQSRSTQLN